MIVFDSYAWFEYFLGTKKGKRVKELIESKEQIYTPTIVLAEIKNAYLKEGKEFESKIEFISTRSNIVELNKETALLAAENKHTHKLYMIDAIVYSTAQFLKTRLLTGDLHFKSLPLAEML